MFVIVLADDCLLTVYMCMYVCMYVCMCMDMDMCMDMYVCVWIWICVWMNKISIKISYVRTVQSTKPRADSRIHHNKFMMGPSGEYII